MYGKKPRAQEAPIYGSSELSLFAEDTILNAGGRHNMREINQVKKQIIALNVPGYQRFFFLIYSIVL